MVKGGQLQPEELDALENARFAQTKFKNDIAIDLCCFFVYFLTEIE